MQRKNDKKSISLFNNQINEEIMNEFGNQLLGSIGGAKDDGINKFDRADALLNSSNDNNTTNNNNNKGNKNALNFHKRILDNKKSDQANLKKTDEVFMFRKSK